MRDASTFTFFVPPRRQTKSKKLPKGKGKTWHVKRFLSFPSPVSPFRTVCEIFKAMHSVFSLLSSSRSSHSLICPRSLDFFSVALSLSFSSLFWMCSWTIWVVLFSTHFYQQQWAGRMFNPLVDFVSNIYFFTLYFNFENKTLQVLSNLFYVWFRICFRIFLLFFFLSFNSFSFTFAKFSFSGCFISFLLHTPLSVWDRDLLFFSSSPSLSPLFATFSLSLGTNIHRRIGTLRK